MKRFKKVFALLTVVFILAASFAGCGKGSGSPEGRTIADIKADGELHVVTEVAFEPFEYYDTDGTTVIGYGKDLLDYIVGDLGVTLNQEDLPWQGILPALEANKCDFVATSVTVTAERAEKYNMTIPIAESTVVLIKRADDTSITSAKDMEGKIVGSQNGSAQEQALQTYNGTLKEAGGSGFSEEKLYTSFPEAYLELKNGVIDLVAQSVSNANVLVKNNPGVYEIVGEIGEKTYFAWAARKGDPEIATYINEEIRKMKEDGSLAKFQEKWFGTAAELPEEGYVPES